jgi:thiamine phosphate synthase YjbQ (UPF0047 family)
VVTESELDRGILIIFVFGSTSAIETIEPRRGLKIEIPFMVSRFIPLNTIYKYDGLFNSSSARPSFLEISCIGHNSKLGISLDSQLLFRGFEEECYLLQIND